ncbi:MAG: flagellar biosynthetic protein FliO [Lachnospiraceae bacterium]|nr:flagellar biosynthetic protein FliO [Lachnospiraceae bacterium]MCM1238851.1 flagellar biosynthetic protein FliO [Lachnospiraceae bacterium]
MSALLAGTESGYAQFIAVLVIFVLVLGVTALTTKWISGYQKQQGANSNIEVIETSRLTNNKFLQIIRVGETYMVIAVCKDTVTMLGEIPKEQLKRSEAADPGMGFRELFDKAVRKNSVNASEPKDDSSK